MDVTELDIVYADNHLLAVNKPPGIPTQPAPHHRDSLEETAKAWVKRAYAKPGAVFLQPAHRLDRPVSGVVLFARTSKALSRLNAAVRSGQWRKQYWAVVERAPDVARGVLTHDLVHDAFRARVVAAGTPGAKTATLEYRVHRRAATGLALLVIRLHTGRYHQIRAQLAAGGHAVLGDRKYGSTAALPGAAIALHHRQLILEHPVRKLPLRLTAALPRQWPWSEFEQP